MRPIDADTIFPNGHVLVWEKDGETTANYILKFIKDAPTLDVEPVRHGRWETDREDIEWGNSLKRKHCTNCGSRPHFDKEKREFVLTNYCPNCGAKMDAKENDDA